MASPTEAQLRVLESKIASGEIDLSRVRDDVRAILESRSKPQEVAAAAVESRPYMDGEGEFNKVSEARRALNVGVENLGRQAIGLGEVAMSTMTGAAAQALGGYKGLYALATKPKGEAISAAVDAINEVSGDLTYQPRTDAAQSQMGALSTVLSPVMEGIDYLGETSADVTGSPAIGAGVKTLLEVGPSFYGVRNPIRYVKTTNAVAKEASDIIQRSGIDPNLPVAEQIAKVPEAAALMANHAKNTAANFQNIQTGVARQYENARKMVRDMYDSAKSAGVVNVDINQLKILDGAMADSLATYDPLLIRPVMTELERFSRMIRPGEKAISDVKLDPVPGRRLGGLPDKLERILTRNEWRAKSASTQELKKSVVELNDLADFRKRVSALSRSPDATVSGAASTMRHAIDKWFDAQLTNDLVSGSADAITKWKSANSAFRQMFDTFRTETSIKNLIERSATPEDVKKWVYGKTAMGAGSHAGAVVSKLKTILGENSPEFTALKQGVAYDIVAPLMDDVLQPEAVSNFRKNLMKVKKDSPTLWKEMFSPEDMAGLDSLNKMLQAAGDIKGRKRFTKDMNQAIAAVLFPKAHPLRTGQVTLQVIDATIDRIRNIGAGSAQEQYIASLTGKPLAGTMFSAKTPAAAALIQALDDEESESISDLVQRLSGRRDETPK